MTIQTQAQLRNSTQSNNNRGQNQLTQSQKDAIELAREEKIKKRDKAYEKKLLEEAKNKKERMEARQVAVQDEMNRAADKGNYQISVEQDIFNKAKKQISTQRNRIKENLTKSGESLINLKKIQSNLPNRKTQESLRFKMGGLQGRIKRIKILQTNQKIKQNLIDIKNYQNKLKLTGNESINDFEKKVETYGKGITKQQKNLGGYINYLGDKVNSIYQNYKNYQQQEKLNQVARTKFQNQVTNFESKNPTEKLIINWKNLRVLGVNSGEFGRRMDINKYNSEINRINNQQISTTLTNAKVQNLKLNKDLVSGRLGINNGLGYSPVIPPQSRSLIPMVSAYQLNDNKHLNNPISKNINEYNIPNSSHNRVYNRKYSGLGLISSIGHTISNTFTNLFETGKKNYQEGLQKQFNPTGAVISSYNKSSYKNYQLPKKTFFQKITSLPSEALVSAREVGRTHSNTYATLSMLGSEATAPLINTKAINRLNEIGNQRDQSYKQYKTLKYQTIPNFRDKNSLNGTFNINKLSIPKRQQYINLQEQINRAAINTRQLSNKYKDYSNKTAVQFDEFGYKRSVPINKLDSLFAYVNQEARTLTLATGKSGGNIYSKVSKTTGKIKKAPFISTVNLIKGKETPKEYISGLKHKKPQEYWNLNQGVITKKDLNKHNLLYVQPKEISKTTSNVATLGLYASPLGTALITSQLGEGMSKENYNPITFIKKNPVESALIGGMILTGGIIKGKDFFGKPMITEGEKEIKISTRGQNILKKRYIAKFTKEETNIGRENLNPLGIVNKEEVPKELRNRFSEETDLSYLNIQSKTRKVKKGIQTKVSLNSGKENYLFKNRLTNEGKQIEERVGIFLKNKGVEPQSSFLIGKQPKVIERNLKGNLLIARRGEEEIHILTAREETKQPRIRNKEITSRKGTTKVTYYGGGEEPYNLLRNYKITEKGIKPDFKIIPKKISKLKEEKIKVMGGRLNSEEFFSNNGIYNKLSKGAERKSYNVLGLSLKKSEKKVKSISYGRKEGVNINGETFVLTSNEINFQPKIYERNAQVYSANSIRKERFPFKSYEAKESKSGKGTIYFLKEKQIPESPKVLKKSKENNNPYTFKYLKEEKPKSYEPKEISKTTQIFKKKSKIGEKEIGIISTLMNPIESTKEIQITKVKPIQTIQRSSLIQTRMKSNLIPMVSAEMIRPKTQTIRNTPVVKSIQMSSTQLVAPKILQTFESRVRIRPIQSSRFRTAQLESPRVKAKTLSKMEKVAQYKGATFSQSISQEINKHTEPSKLERIKERMKIHITKGKSSAYTNALRKVLNKYEVFKKVKGKEKKIGTVFGLEKASKTLGKGLKKDLSASGFIINIKTKKKVAPKKIINIIGKEFRKSKLKKKTIVQKRNRRLSSGSERTNIQRERTFLGGRKNVNSNFF